jgi:hypothetical protein
MRRLRATLKDLAELAQPPEKDAVLLYLKHIDDIVSRSFAEEYDRNRAKQEDRHGLGLELRRDEG